MVIRSNVKISQHAVKRFRERVVPNIDISDDAIGKLILVMTTDRVNSCISNGHLDERYILKNNFLKFCYDKEENKIYTVLPFRKMNESNLIKISLYYGIEEITSELGVE